MEKALGLLQKIGLSRPQIDGDDEYSTPFDRRLKMVTRARMTNPPPMGRSVFRRAEKDPEA